MTATLRHYVREAQRGDESAVEILFDQFKPLFKKQLGQYSRRYRYSEDLESSIHSAAFLCIMDFDLEKPGTVQQAMQMSIHNFLERESYHMAKYNSNIQKNVEDENGGLTDLPEGCMAPINQCPEYQYDKIERQEQVWEALYLLSEKERNCIVWHHMHGHTYREIAKKCHLSEATIRRIVGAGMERLTHIIANNPVLAD